MIFSAKVSLRGLVERNRLVEEHHRIPYLVVRQMRGWLMKCRISPEDALQICRLSLIRAAELYDHSGGAKFSTYAISCCRHGLARHCRQDGLIRLPANQVSERRRKFVEQARRIVFIGDCDTGVVDGHPRGWADIPDRCEVDRQDFLAIERLWEELRRMPQRLALAVRLRYIEGRTLEECGSILGVTKERSRQLIRNGLRRLMRDLPESVMEAFAS